MPFLAKCKRCGWIAPPCKKREFLAIVQKEHDIESHNDPYSEETDFCTWNTAVISTIDYNGIIQAMKDTRFWRAIRTNPAVV
jgi:hypothetical protein